MATHPTLRLHLTDDNGHELYDFKELPVIPTMADAHTLIAIIERSAHAFEDTWVLQAIPYIARAIQDQEPHQ